MNLMDYIAAAPEMTLLGLICVVMIADLFIENENRIVTFWLSMAVTACHRRVLFATAPEAGTWSSTVPTSAIHCRRY